MNGLTIDELLRATGGTWFDRALPGGRPVGAVSIDSRTLNAGDVYWALRGEQHDGHQFAPSALQKGAALAVVDQPLPEFRGQPVIQVRNTLAALQSLAAAYRKSWRGKAIGITGSVGKTTTRAMIHATLSAALPGVESPKNFNNEIGLPLSLLQIDRAVHQYAVLEMGAGNPDDIRDLAAIARPDIGVITAISPAHYGRLGSLQQIARTKGDLLEALPADGVAVLPGDDPVVRRLAERCRARVIFVGEQVENHLVISHVRVRPEGIHFQLDGQSYLVRGPGRHFATNAGLAVAIGKELGLDSRQIAEGLATFQPVSGRCQIVEIGPWVVLDDSYNASPASLAAGLETLAGREWIGQGRRIAVLGDMAELGEIAEREHLRAGQRAGALGFDLIIAFGEHAETLARGARTMGFSDHQLVVAHDIENVYLALDCWLEPGDVLLVKGSRVMRMERVIDYLKQQAHDHRGRPFRTNRLSA